MLFSFIFCPHLVYRIIQLNTIQIKILKILSITCCYFTIHNFETSEPTKWKLKEQKIKTFASIFIGLGGMAILKTDWRNSSY